jgi:hypothetical protein
MTDGKLTNEPRAARGFLGAALSTSRAMSISGCFRLSLSAERLVQKSPRPLVHGVLAGELITAMARFKEEFRSLLTYSAVPIRLAHREMAYGFELKLETKLIEVRMCVEYPKEKQHRRRLMFGFPPRRLDLDRFERLSGNLAKRLHQLLKSQLKAMKRVQKNTVVRTAEKGGAMRAK